MLGLNLILLIDNNSCPLDLVSLRLSQLTSAFLRALSLDRSFSFYMSMTYLRSLLMPFYLCMLMTYFSVLLLFLLKEACNKLNFCLILVSYWFKENRLLINTSKSHFMVIGTQSRIKNINEIITINLNEKPLDEITSTQLVCMIIDKNLNFNQHMTIS